MHRLLECSAREVHRLLKLQLHVRCTGYLSTARPVGGNLQSRVRVGSAKRFSTLLMLDLVPKLLLGPLAAAACAEGQQVRAGGREGGKEGGQEGRKADGGGAGE